MDAHWPLESSEFRDQHSSLFSAAWGIFHFECVSPTLQFYLRIRYGPITFTRIRRIGFEIPTAVIYTQCENSDKTKSKLVRHNTQAILARNQHSTKTASDTNKAHGFSFPYSAFIPVSGIKVPRRSFFPVPSDIPSIFYIASHDRFIRCQENSASKVPQPLRGEYFSAGGGVTVTNLAVLVYQRRVSSGFVFLVFFGPRRQFPRRGSGSNTLTIRRFKLKQRRLHKKRCTGRTANLVEPSQDGLQNEFRERNRKKEGPKKRGLEQLSIKIPGTRVLIALTVSRVAYYGPLPAPTR
ncbi:hypothetical protein CDAR_177021 [Caerostris darwini]|uniref:Uncharacterized protein n=1 Tax=Caerostris darwini TaxID=1538125 RepID=A0AAV4UBV2_9ARAC|nr:hypothetical protein CDAR_177021 [Caerostris darwini]